ncbi:MAG: cell division protein ZapA [Proteobacteria bacterium]|jgi:cell division protein ZapA|nr:cell division protein ZapA [Pseudomonadota bacterium]MCG6936407.1 cell division protein ZapA [Pseudomonadota bacterium]
MTEKSDTKAVTVTILDKEYVFSCTEEEHHDLIRSADYLDRKMREIRETGKIIGSDRIAVMAALNISNELLAGANSAGKTDATVSQRIKGLEAKIEDALYRSRQLEI